MLVTDSWLSSTSLLWLKGNLGVPFLHDHTIMWSDVGEQLEQKMLRVHRTLAYILVFRPLLISMFLRCHRRRYLRFRTTTHLTSFEGSFYQAQHSGAGLQLCTFNNVATSGDNPKEFEGLPVTSYTEYAQICTEVPPAGIQLFVLVGQSAQLIYKGVNRYL